MTVEVAIRDDDVNFFTGPEELERAYADLPGGVPVSFGVVPFQGCRESPAVPEDRWEDDGKMPVGDNGALVEYLRDGARDGALSVMLHGYDHRRYGGRPEFVAGDDLPGRIDRGRDHLERVLDVDVEVFVPPNNSFSRAGLDAVKDVGLRTFYYPTPVNRPKTPEVAWVTARDLWFKFRNKAGGPVRFLRDADRFWRRRDRSVFMPVRPWPYTVRGGREFTAVTLTRDGPVDPVKRQLDVAARHGAKFCLAVHYHSFRSEGFRERFYGLIEYARSLDAEFVRAEELFTS